MSNEFFLSIVVLHMLSYCVFLIIVLHLNI